MRRPLALASVFVTLAVTLPLPAQVPPGWAVYSRRDDPALTLTGGISLLDPRTGTFAPLTGLPLPAELTSTSTTTWSGARGIAVRDSDGVIFAAGVQRNVGMPVHVFRIDVAGTAVTAITPYPIGASNGQAIIEQMDWLPDGRLVFAHRGLTGQGQGVGFLDPATGAVTMRAAGIGASTLTGMCVSRDGNTIYVGATWNLGQVLRMPVTGTAYGTPVANISGGLYQLAMDHQGLLYVGARPSSVQVLDPNAPLPTPTVVNPIARPEAMTIDRVTGRILVATGGGSPNYSWIDPATGQATPVPGTYPLDYPVGIAYRNPLSPYGAPAVGAQNDYRWSWEANPGGAPAAGNLGFTITMNSSPGTAFGFLALSAGRIAPFSLPSPAVSNILLDPNLVGGWLPLLPAAQASVQLPLPPTLPPMTVYAQVFHFEGNAILGSQGLLIGVH